MYQQRTQLGPPGYVTASFLFINVDVSLSLNSALQCPYAHIFSPWRT